MGKSRGNINIPDPRDLPDPRSMPQPVRQVIVDAVLSAFEGATSDRMARASEEEWQRILSSPIPEAVAPPIMASNILMQHLGDNPENSRFFLEGDVHYMD